MKMGKKWMWYVSFVIILLGLFVGISLIKHKDDAKVVNSSDIVDDNEGELGYEIVKVKDNDGDVCVEVLDEFYQDDKYVYVTSNPCVLDAYVVRSSEGEELTVSEALEKGKINLTYLDAMGIKYYSYEKSATE